LRSCSGPRVRQNDTYPVWADRLCCDVEAIPHNCIGAAVTDLYILTVV
jgi:hypothetical protein